MAVLPALARQKLPDPVLFFAGGPGQSAIELAGTVDALLNRLGERRDIVLIDQRGTGHSAPLQCDTPSAEESVARAFRPAVRCPCSVRSKPRDSSVEFTVRRSLLRPFVT